MGKQQVRLLKFALDFPGWHTCGKDSRKTMYNLESYGLLEVAKNPSGPQFRIRQSKY